MSYIAPFVKYLCAMEAEIELCTFAFLIQFALANVLFDVEIPNRHIKAMNTHAGKHTFGYKQITVFSLFYASKSRCFRVCCLFSPFCPINNGRRVIRYVFFEKVIHKWLPC